MLVNVEAKEVLKKRVARAGNIGRVYVPGDWVGKTVIVILEVERGKDGG